MREGRNICRDQVLRARTHQQDTTYGREEIFAGISPLQGLSCRKEPWATASCRPWLLPAGWCEAPNLGKYSSHAIRCSKSFPTRKTFPKCISVRNPLVKAISLQTEFSHDSVLPSAAVSLFLFQKDFSCYKIPNHHNRRGEKLGDPIIDG